MDRTTGKTNDCYVEFFSTGDAQAAANKLLFRGGPQLKLGTPPNDRIVTVEVSSQDFLLKELFPRAKNVLWSNGNPIVEVIDEPFNSGFKGFVTGEEMVMLVRHAEQPHRVSAIQYILTSCQASEISRLCVITSLLFSPVTRLGVEKSKFVHRFLFRFNQLVTTCTRTCIISRFAPLPRSLIVLLILSFTNVTHSQATLRNALNEHTRP